MTGDVGPKHATKYVQIILVKNIGNYPGIWSIINKRYLPVISPALYG